MFILILGAVSLVNVMEVVLGLLCVTSSGDKVPTIKEIVEKITSDNTMLSLVKE